MPAWSFTRALVQNNVWEQHSARRYVLRIGNSVRKTYSDVSAWPKSTGLVPWFHICLLNSIAVFDTVKFLDLKELDYAEFLRDIRGVLNLGGLNTNRLSATPCAQADDGIHLQRVVYVE